MKKIITALFIVLVFGCKGKEDTQVVFVEKTDYAKVYADEVSLESGTIRIRGEAKIVYDTCSEEIIILGLQARGATKVMLTGTFAMGDTIYFDENASLAFYGKNDSVIRVIKGGKPPISIDSIRFGGAPKPSPLPDTTKPLKIKMQPKWRMLDGGLFILDSFFNDDSKGYWYYWNQAAIEDTVECVFIVSNTNDINGICQYFDKRGFIVGSGISERTVYLDERKRLMPNNFIVWLPKEIK